MTVTFDIMLCTQRGLMVIAISSTTKLQPQLRLGPFSSGDGSQLNAWPQSALPAHPQVTSSLYLFRLLHFPARSPQDREKCLHLVTFIDAFSIKYISANIQSPWRSPLGTTEKVIQIVIKSTCWHLSVTIHVNQHSTAIPYKKSTVCSFWIYS